jgi:hypothetical protein
MPRRGLAAGAVLGALVLAACAKGSSSGSPSQPTRGNSPPTGATITVSPAGQAITAVTSVTFAGTGTDPDGDPLTFSWNLGDGTTVTGQTVTRVYPRDGTFNVSLTVSDGRGGSALASAAVTARSLAGIWTSAAREWNFEIEQTGTTLRGRLLGFKDTRLADPLPLNGTARSPRAVEFDVRGPFVVGGLRVPGLGFTGTAAADLNTMTGTLDEGRSFGEVLRRR